MRWADKPCWAGCEPCSSSLVHPFQANRNFDPRRWTNIFPRVDAGEIVTRTVWTAGSLRGVIGQSLDVLRSFACRLTAYNVEQILQRSHPPHARLSLLYTPSFQDEGHPGAKMRSLLFTVAFVASTCVASGTCAVAPAADSLADVCTSSYVTAHLPAADFYPGITLDTVDVTVTPVYNATVTDQNFFPDATFDYCSVVLTYSHNGLNDEVVVTYWLPAPDKFENRYLSTGGMWLS